MARPKTDAEVRRLWLELACGYAFPFRSVDGSCDFVLISVHLQPDQGPSYRARRKQELQSIAAWIDAHDQIEQDFIIVGDMNIENVAELTDTTPNGFLSLNDECRPTNTKGDRPYDHVMYRPQFTSEVEQQTDMQVIDLVQAMQPSWNRPEPYPGAPYDHNGFRAVYSDHHPVWFRLMTQPHDDDRAVASIPIAVWAAGTPIA
jgi:endonuclease/exonuclease/phosphatase family metal-dependent hydrolase